MKHVITVPTNTAWADALDQPERESVDETFADGHLCHQYIDTSLLGMDPLELLILMEECHETN